MFVILARHHFIPKQRILPTRFRFRCFEFSTLSRKDALIEGLASPTASTTNSSIPKSSPSSSRSFPSSSSSSSFSINSQQQRVQNSFKVTNKKSNTIISPNQRKGWNTTSPTAISTPLSIPSPSVKPKSRSTNKGSTSSYSPVYSEPPVHITNPILTPPSLTPSKTVSTNGLFQALPTNSLLDEQHSLSIAIIGEPNAGKSTILNHMIKSHISAVSPKYNTTRTKILGVLTEGNTQLLFYDTPGLVHEDGENGWKYHKELVTASLDAANDADYIIYVMDIARRFDTSLQQSLLTAIKLCIQSNSKLLIVANKCDLIKGMPLDISQKHLSEKIFIPGNRSSTTISTINMNNNTTNNLNISLGSSGLPNAAKFIVSSLILPNSFITSVPSSSSKTTTASSSSSNDNQTNNTRLSSSSNTRQKLHQDVLALKLDILANTLEQLCLEYETKLIQKQKPQTSTITSQQVNANNDNDNDNENKENIIIPRKARNLLTPGMIIPIAAVHNNGIDIVRNHLINYAPIRPWIYSENILTDRSISEQIKDIIREKIFRRLHYEIPYIVQQETRSWREIDSAYVPSDYKISHPNINIKRITEIHQDIIVPTQRIARMLLFNKGLHIKEIAELAKVDIEKILKTRVRLHLHITVKEKRSKLMNHQ